jgi:pyruvate dehydrogenase E1 component alpha subunit
MSKKYPCVKYNFFSHNRDQAFIDLSKAELLEVMKEMLLIRNFEVRAEQSYQKKLIWGFLHLYIGQEAIQTAAVHAMGKTKNHWITTYRCHALALLLGVTPREAMAELYGKASGNAKGRGGSMHLYGDRMYGGEGIVGSHVPLAAGLAFSIKYRKIKDEVAVCFLGDGAVAQGAFHEAMNLAALWDLPLIVVIENNQYGMGTQLHRAIANLPIAENLAKAYGISSYTLDGMDFLASYHGFKSAFEEVKNKQRPVLIETVGHRYRGHSVSDPALYRTKQELESIMEEDPIPRFFSELEQRGYLTKEEFEAMNQEQKNIVLDAMDFAAQSPFPPITELEEGVYAL